MAMMDLSWPMLPIPLYLMSPGSPRGIPRELNNRNVLPTEG